MPTSCLKVQHARQECGKKLTLLRPIVRPPSNVDPAAPASETNGEGE